MLKYSIVIAAGLLFLQVSASAVARDPALRLAQLGPPPPGSAFGTESGTYGSSIGTDVRGSRAGDIMDPNDLIQRTDPEKKKEAESREKEKEAAQDKERLDPRSTPGYNTRATERPGGPGPETGALPGTTRSTQPGATPAAPGSPGSAGGAPAGSVR